MRSFKAIGGKIAAAVLVASMIFQSTALAEPIDELREAFANSTQEGTQESMLEEYLGISDIKEAVKENGLRMQLFGSPMKETAAMLESEGSSIGWNLQIDPVLKKWILNMDMNIPGGDFLDVGLYGDTEMLALSIAQLYGGALAIRSGNLAEQMSGSVLAQALGLTEGIPEIELSFYPEESDEVSDVLSDFEEELTEKLEKLSEDLQVWKTEGGDLITYRVVLTSSDIMDIYRFVVNEYVSIWTETGLLLTMNGSDDVEAELDDMFDKLEKMLGDEVTVDFRVRDGLFEGISYELFIDPSVIEQDSATLEDDVIVDGSASDNEDNAMYVIYDITYTDPTDLSSGFEADVTVQDLERTDRIEGKVIYDSESDDTTQNNSLTVNLTDPQNPEENNLSWKLFESSFDSETGDYDVHMWIPEDESLDDSVILTLDSTFSEVESGRRFCWTIDELSMTIDGETAGVTAEIRVEADAGDIAELPGTRMLFELTEEDLNSLALEISMMGQNWYNAFFAEAGSEASGTDDAV